MKIFLNILLAATFFLQFHLKATAQGFNSVYSKDGISVIASGNNGNVFRSYDGCLNFLSFSIGSVNLNSIVNFNNTIIITGNSGIIYYSTNDGSTWNNQTLGTQNINSISFADANTGWAVGDGGTIYKSNIILNTKEFFYFSKFS